MHARIWLSTLHINLLSVDHQCHVMPSGLKKYGWEAHDGKSYGRQELYDEHFHLTTSWVSVCVAQQLTATFIILIARFSPGCAAGYACLGPVLSLHDGHQKGEQRVQMAGCKFQGANVRIQMSGCKCQDANAGVHMTARAFFTMLQH